MRVLSNLFDIAAAAGWLFVMGEVWSHWTGGSEWAKFGAMFACVYVAVDMGIARPAKPTSPRLDEEGE